MAPLLGWAAAAIVCCVAGAAAGQERTGARRWSRLCTSAAPVVHSSAPVVHDSAPAVHSSAPPVYSAPPVHYSAPAVHYSTPVVHSPAPAVYYQPPSAVHFSPPSATYAQPPSAVHFNAPSAADYHPFAAAHFNAPTAADAQPTATPLSQVHYHPPSASPPPSPSAGTSRPPPTLPADHSRPLPVVDATTSPVTGSASPPPTPNTPSTPPGPGTAGATHAATPVRAAAAHAATPVEAPPTHAGPSAQRPPARSGRGSPSDLAPTLSDSASQARFQPTNATTAYTPRTYTGDVYAWHADGQARRTGLDEAFRASLRARASWSESYGESYEDAEEAFDEASAMESAGKYGDATTVAEHALEVVQHMRGDYRLSTAKYLNLLGRLYWQRGDLTRAEALLQRALAIHEAALGTNRPEVAASLDRLGVVYQTQGLYGRAEPLHRRALAIREAVLGKRHEEVAASLNNLAILYKAQGLYGRAEPLHKRALAIREAVLGTRDPAVAFSLGNLALLYREQGQYDRAEPLVRRALAIQEAALGATHPDVAFSLSTLASLYESEGRYGEAEPLVTRALAIREAALGKDHPQTAASLNELATLYRQQGLYTQAEPLAERALELRVAALGENHPDVASSLNELAQIQLARERLPDAVPLLERSLALSEERLRREALDFSESRLASFLQFLRADEERLYSLARAYPNDAGVRRLALTAALLRKGRSVEETANTSRTVYRTLGGDDRETFERLRGLRSQLARVSLEGPGARPLAEYQQELKDLVDEGDALEASLAKRSARLRALTALPSSAEVVDRVAAALPADGALIELIAYADRPLAPRAGAPDAGPPSPLRYLALVLRPDARIRVADLGPAAPIDTAASRLRDALASRDAGYQAPAQALYALAFQPLAPLLANVQRVFLSPDGQLSLVPFAALHDGRRFLVDAFDFTYLTSGKDLLPRSPEVSSSGSMMVLADPDFDASPSVSAPADAPTVAERSYSLEPFSPTLRADLGDRPWVPLPGTRHEAEALQRLFPKAEVFVGAGATKERLLRVTAPGILHVATHGFFLEDTPAPAGSRGVVQVGPVGQGAPVLRLPDPLLRSGLVLAGARAPDTDSARPRLDRTLVTALELAGLDLWGTQLVVLSACDTGRGDVKLGQGVYGLRRSLVIAGAETVVMSLWKVDDEITRALMESYYRNLLAGKGRTASLRNAMQALRQAQPHPHFWAPFISLGRDAPLGALQRASP